VSDCRSAFKKKANPESCRGSKGADPEKKLGSDKKKLQISKGKLGKKLGGRVGGLFKNKKIKTPRTSTGATPRKKVKLQLRPRKKKGVRGGKVRRRAHKQKTRESGGEKRVLCQ